MPASDRGPAGVAAAILDGTPIDWLAAETAATDEERALLEELRLLCTVADVHRQLPVDGEPGDGGGDDSDAQYWGRLRLIERVGAGTFGDVYRAWDPRLHREVALKLIATSEGSADARATAIIREGRLLARVRHPGVVTLYDAEQIDTRVGLSMEFVEGPTLEQRLQQDGVCSAAETVEIGLQLCEALAAVHEAGVLHRDVKAANVVVKRDGRIVLMDFGAGRPLEHAGTADLTGTPLCLAPEVLRGEEATAGSDVYSVGVLLHRMLTGTYPVPAGSLPELRAAHAQRLESPTRMDAARSAAVPARLAAVLEKATDPRLERRYGSASALAADLRALGPAARPRRWALGLAAASVVIAVAAGWILGTRGSGETMRIAVMPFAVADGEPDSAAVREGVAKDLIARLETYENTRVVSAGSVFSADGLNLPLKEIGARLGVSSILTGRLIRAGGTLAVDVTLVRLPDEQRLWSAHYTQPVSQMLEVPRAIAADLAGELELKRDAGLQGWPTRNQEAYTLYVRGRTALDRFSPDGTRLALRLFQQALTLDPEYAQAHAGLAQLYLQMNPAIPNLTGQESIQRASEAASRAMALDASLPEAHVAAAGILSMRGDWAGAEREHRRAIELGPSNVVARQQYAQWLALLGRSDEALEQARAGEALDPLSPRAMMAVASVLRFAGRYEEAIAQAHKVLEIDPTHSVAYLNLGHNYQGLGQLDKAIEAFQKMGRPSGNLGHAYALTGRHAEARALIAQFEQRHAKTGLGVAEIAQIYSGLGEIDLAFQWLERLDEFHTGWPTTFKVAPVWDPLRSDPRFATLLKKYRLAD